MLAFRYYWGFIHDNIDLINRQYACF